MHADKATTQPAPRALRVAAASALLSLLLATLAAPAHCQAPAAPAGPAAPASGAAGPAGPAGRPRGRLLKVPKVYNALITSNEPLLPSRTEQATVGQVLYYPPQHHHGYPASSGPLILPQVAAQAPPLLGPGGPGGPAQQPPQPLVSLPALPALPPQQQPGPADPGLELHLQGGTERADHNAEQATPWPVVYASDVQAEQDTQRYTAGDFDQSLVLQQYSTGDASQPQALQRYPNEQAGQSEQQALQRYTADQSAAVGQPEAAQPPVFPAARAVQTVERVAEPGQYRPPPTVDIDSIKNNRPVGTGIRDVPPPPLPVGRGRKPPMGPQPLPPGILPF